MIHRLGLRWQLVAWVVATMLAVLAIVFVVVYRESGSQLRSQTDEDVRGDITELSEAVKSFQADSSSAFATQVRHYIRDQPSSTTSSLLFAVVPGHRAVSNHPELLGAGRPDSDESRSEQAREDALGKAMLTGSTGLRTAQAPDLGPIRIQERVVSVAGKRVRVGAGESLLAVTRAQRSIGRSFLLAGAIGVALVLLASYIAGAVVSRPLRRLARVAARIDEGDLEPRMAVSSIASLETRVLADSFNRMLDRLAVAFARQRDFVADASHELRTPLTVIAGQLEVLAADRNPDPADIERTQRIVQAEVARTSRLVDDMLLLIRADHDDFLRRGAIELPEFIHDLWATTTHGQERRLQLDPVPDGTLDADPDRLAQALRNLIDNALAHTDAPDGLVRLSVRGEPGHRVTLTVSDDGPGIPEEHRDRVFERFHRTDDGRDRATGGAGLGLAIVQAIAQAHGGTVSAGAAREGGAALRVELPGFQADPSPARGRQRRPHRESPFTQRR